MQASELSPLLDVFTGCILYEELSKYERSKRPPKKSALDGSGNTEETVVNSASRLVGHS